MVESVGQVDVIALTTDQRAVAVKHPVREDDDGVLATGGVDESVAAGERPAEVQEVVEKVLDVLAIVGMLMGEQQFGGGHDGTWLVAVHARDLVGPFPSLPHEPETEAAHVQMRHHMRGDFGVRAAGQSGGVMPRLFHQRDQLRRPNGSTCMIATTTVPTTNPITADTAVLTSQASRPPTPWTA